MALVAQAAQDTSASQAWCLANETCQSLIGNEEMIVSHVLRIRPSHHLGSVLIRYLLATKCHIVLWRFDLLPLLKRCLVSRVLEKC